MLNQDEIDALLSGKIEVEDGPGGISRAGAGSPITGRRYLLLFGKKNIRPYNFWSPDRFSQEQMRAIGIMHEDLRSG